MYKKLAEIRKKRKYKLEDIAMVIDKSPANYYKKEMGDVPFTLDEAKKIADFLNLSVNTIFFNNNISESEKKQKGDDREWKQY